MLDSFLSSPYRTEFNPWPVSEHYAAERAGGVPEAMLLPGELTVHRSDGARMSYYLDWPEEFTEYTRAVPLRPRSKNGYPQDFTLSVAVRDGQAVFTATALSFWEQRDGRPHDREPIARGYVDVASYESCEEYAGNSAALIGWDIADLYPARMALIRTLCEGIARSITVGARILADSEVQVDHKDGDLLALHVNAVSTVGGMVRALVIEQDRVPSGVSTGTATGASERTNLQTRAYYANVLSPVPGEFGNLVWSHSEDAVYYPYRPTRHKPIFHAPCPPQKLPLAVQVLMEHLPAAPLAATRTAPKRRPYLPGQARVSSPRH